MFCTYIEIKFRLISNYSMGFKNFFRNFRLNHGVFRKLDLNLEILEPIPVSMPNQLNSVPSKSESSKNVCKKTRDSNLDRINKLFDSHPHLITLKSIVPTSYLLQKPSLKSKLRIFLIDKVVARDIMDLLKPHLETHNGYVMEMNAGAGVLTEELLKSDLSNLRIYEPDPILCNNLLKLKDLYKPNARLFLADLQSLSHIFKLDSNDGKGRTATLFSDLKTVNWQDEPAVKLIGALPDERFIVHIIFSTALQSGLCQYGRPELYLMIPQEKYEKLTSKPEDQKMYRSNSVAFQVMFDYKELAKVPENSFVPWCAYTNAKKKAKEGKEVNDSLCLVKITPKRDLLQRISPDLLRTFLYFIKYMMHKKSALLIDLFEKWVPGSGVRLISRGYTIYTDTGSLTPNEFLEIYLEFTSWPEFSSSSFIPSAESVLEKLLQYDSAEGVMSDTKFNMLLKKDSKDSDDVEDDDPSDDQTH